MHTVRQFRVWHRSLSLCEVSAIHERRHKAVLQGKEARYHQLQLGTFRWHTFLNGVNSYHNSGLMGAYCANPLVATGMIAKDVPTTELFTY